MAAAAINIVMLKESGRWQHHVRHQCRLGHELFVHTDEQIIACEAALDLVLVGRNRHRIGVLDDKRMNLPAALQHFALAGQNCTDARLVEHAHRPVPNVEPFNQRLVELEYVCADMEGATTLILPSACHRRNAACCVHVRCTVARA